MILSIENSDADNYGCSSDESDQAIRPLKNKLSKGENMIIGQLILPFVINLENTTIII
jgi:hypothetical protein